MMGKEMFDLGLLPKDPMEKSWSREALVLKRDQASAGALAYPAARGFLTGGRSFPGRAQGASGPRDFL
jgi:hypothetical protein